MCRHTTTTVVHAGAYAVTIDALFGVPAHTTTLVHPHGKEAGVKIPRITTQITCRCTTSRPPPPDGKEACVKMRAYQNTHYVPLHNIGFDEKPAYGGDTRHR